MKKILFIPSMLLLTAIICSAQINNKSNPVKNSNTKLQVKISNGILQGVKEQSGIISFKGIPFASPPIGILRWKEPQPVKNWKGIRQATEFGARAMQGAIFGDMGFRSNGMSEDCLYLNVWTPEANRKAKLPVLVYFYGGGFVAGDGSESRYDGESMSKKGIVSLTVNYRLGVFGLLSHPELSNESGYNGSGNYTIMDQAAALKWVEENIAAFGGDPEKITIAGESAGSISVSAQMASPLAKNIIAGAIGESGSLLGALPAVKMEDAEKTGLEFAKAVGAKNLSELRAMNADTLLNASTKFGPFRFSMTVDGYVFPKDPLAIYQSGEQSKVPLLVGWNSEEMNYRMVLGNEKPTVANFEKAIAKLYPDQSAEVLKLYKPTNDEEVEQIATELASDRFISFSTWRWADLHAKTSNKPVYRYYYYHPRPDMTAAMGDATPGLAGGVEKNTGAPRPPRAKGAVHSAEIEYAMGNLHLNKVYDWTPEDFKVSENMQNYFANFVKTLDPNGQGLPQWPTTASSSPAPVLYIGEKVYSQPDQHSERYRFFEKSRK